MTEEELRRLLASQESDASAPLIWRAGMPEWCASSKLDELAHESPSKASSTAEDSWYYSVAGQTTGPVDANAVALAMASDSVSGASLVWRQGLPEWIPLADCDELAKLVHAAFAEQAAANRSSKQPGSAASGPEDASGAGKKRQRTAARPAGGNPWVYVTGLPPDANAGEILAHFRRVGQVRADPSSGKPMLRL
jgi:hypothetical protein